MREKLINILKSNAKVYSAFVFGSYGTEEFTAESDIDIAIVGEVELMDLLILESELEEAINKEVDLVKITELPNYLQLQIMVRNDRLVLNDEEKHFEYLDKINYWYKNEYSFWKKSMIERGHIFD